MFGSGDGTQAQFEETLADITPGTRGSVVFSQRINPFQPPPRQGNPVGTLLAGHEYQPSYSAVVAADAYAASATTGTLSITGTGNVGLYFTPEPSEAALLGCGAMACALRGRRSRR